MLNLYYVFAYTLLISWIMSIESGAEDGVVAETRPNCPHCKCEKVQRFGRNRGGTIRWRCVPCWKTFTPHPNRHRLSPHQYERVRTALGMGFSKRNIALVLHVSPKTIYKIGQGWVPTFYSPLDVKNMPSDLLAELRLIRKK